MADCNKTVDFLRVLKRYCAEQHCYDCPICPPDGTVGDTCIASVGGAGLEHAEKIIPTLQRWADGRPVETWLQRLKKALPGVKVDRIPNMHCPGEFFPAGTGRLFCPYKDDAVPVDCWDCWMQEAPDEL